MREQDRELMSLLNGLDGKAVELELLFNIYLRCLLEIVEMTDLVCTGGASSTIT